MAAEMGALSDVKFTDRTENIPGAAPPDIVSVKSGVACAITFRHNLNVDMSRSRYTGAGKFCMPVTDAQLSHFRILTEAFAERYVPNVDTGSRHAVFDYDFLYRGVRHSGSYRYDGGSDFDHSLGSFDTLLMDIVENGEAIASIEPSFRVSLVDRKLVVDFVAENTGKVDVALTGIKEWAADQAPPDRLQVVFGLSSEGTALMVAPLHSGNYGGDSSLLDGPILIGAGKTLSLRFELPLQESPTILIRGNYLVSGAMRIEAKFDGSVAGRIDTPISPVEVALFTR